MNRILIFILISLFFILSCNKKLFDKRNSFIGKYVFTIKIDEINTKYIGYYFHDTIVFKGKIEYGIEKDEIIITYTDKLLKKFKIVMESELVKCFSDDGYGELKNDKFLHVHLYWGGLGGGITHLIDGIKICK